MLMYKQLENFDLASQFEADYERGLRKISENDRYNTEDHHSMIYSGI